MSTTPPAPTFSCVPIVHLPKSQLWSVPESLIVALRTSATSAWLATLSTEPWELLGLVFHGKLQLPLVNFRQLGRPQKKQVIYFSITAFSELQHGRSFDTLHVETRFGRWDSVITPGTSAEETCSDLISPGFNVCWWATRCDQAEVIFCGQG